MIKSLFNYLMKNKIIVFFLILLIAISVSNVIERQEEKYIVNILNNYELVNYIVLNTNNKELVITDNKELEKYKRNLEVGMYIGNYNEKKIIKNDIIKEAMQVKFYIDDSLLFTENIYLLNNDTKTEFFFEVNDFKYIAEVNKIYSTLKITDEIFNDILY